MILDVLLYSGGSGYVDVRVFSAIVAFYVLGSAWDRCTTLADGALTRLLRDDRSAIEKLRDDYLRGDLTLDEFEQRAELALDDRAAVVVDRLEAVDGVGPERAIALADEFGNVEGVRRADVDELTQAHGVGPATAEKIRNAF